MLFELFLGMEPAHRTEEVGEPGVLGVARARGLWSENQTCSYQACNSTVCPFLVTGSTKRSRRCGRSRNQPLSACER